MASPSFVTARPPIKLTVFSLLRADTIALVRNSISALSALYLPLLLLIVTSFGKAESKLGGGSLIVGLALTTGLLTSGLLGYSLALAHDRDAGVLQRLRVTPSPTWAIMGSRLAVQVVVSLIASVLVVIVGSILHGLTLSAAQYVLVVGLVLLGSAMFLALGQALVGLVKKTSAINALGRVLFVILLLTGLLGETGILGDTIKVIAAWSPVGALMTLLSDSLIETAWSGNDFLSLLTCLIYVLVFTFIGIRWFRWESQ